MKNPFFWPLGVSVRVPKKARTDFGVHKETRTEPLGAWALRAIGAAPVTQVYTTTKLFLP